MKKLLIPTLFVILVLSGCQKKEGTGAMDTTAPKQGPHTVTGVGSAPTTSITPPAVVGGQAGALKVSIPKNTHSVLFSVIFAGSDPTQTVTISNGSTVLMRFPFSAQWTSFVVPGSPTANQTITVTDSIGTTLAPYPMVESAPVNSGLNTQGLDVTAYSDNNTPVNKTIIVVTDLCGLF